MKIIFYILIGLLSLKSFADCEVDEIQLKINAEHLEEMVNSAILYAKENHNINAKKIHVDSCILNKNYLRMRLSPHAKKDNTEYFTTIYCTRSDEKISCNSYVGRIHEYKGINIELGSHVEEKSVPRIFQCIEKIKKLGKLRKYDWDHNAKKLIGTPVKSGDKIKSIYRGSEIYNYIVFYSDSRFEVKFSLDGECSVTWLPNIVV